LPQNNSLRELFGAILPSQTASVPEFEPPRSDLEILRSKSVCYGPVLVQPAFECTYASMCICTHTHTYTHIHICAQPAASVLADVYVVVKTHLCNIHTCSCSSAENTCKVHATLTAKKCTCIYTYTYTYTHTHAHENTCACMTPSAR